MNEQVVWYVHNIVTLFVRQQTLSRLTRKKRKEYNQILILIQEWKKSDKKKQLNDYYIIIYNENRLSDIVEVTFFSN